MDYWTSLQDHFWGFDWSILLSGGARFAKTWPEGVLACLHMWAELSM